MELGSFAVQPQRVIVKRDKRSSVKLTESSIDVIVLVMIKGRYMPQLCENSEEKQKQRM